MRILHTADLHLGQIIYRHYERADEHRHFFTQLEEWIVTYKPDALVVSGDVFDVQQPSAATWRAFNDFFVGIRRRFPKLHIAIAAGNHDSPSRLQSHSGVWKLADVSLVGTPPPPVPSSSATGWEERFIVRLSSGYIILLPYMASDRGEAARHLQEYVARENTGGLPVVMTAHLAVTGSDTRGHDFDIGTLRAVEVADLGEDYDYLALGHIHKAQTIGHSSGDPLEGFHGTAPVARYSGSPVHVSDAEAYPHSVSLVDIDSHGGTVDIKPLRVNQLRHFLTLPSPGKEAFDSEKLALREISRFISVNDGCYLRLRISDKADLAPDFTSKVYSLIEESGKDIRYNPRMLVVATAEDEPEAAEVRGILQEAEDFREMQNPLEFVRMTIDRYPDLDPDTLDEAFSEIEEELRRMQEESNPSSKRKAT